MEVQVTEGSFSSLTPGIQEIANEFVLSMGFHVRTISLVWDNQICTIHISSDDAAYMIGHHGETLTSMQIVLKNVIRSKLTDLPEIHIVLDVEGYRQQYEQKLSEMIRTAIQECSKNKKQEQHLPPMTPYYRRYVHEYLRKHAPDAYEATSAGDGSTRHVVIRPKQKA